MKKNVKRSLKRTIAIDYPGNKKAVSGAHYAVRISAAPCDKVEVSIDSGPWATCDNSAGYWWFHLRGLAAGEHRLAARVNLAGKRYFALRKFEVGTG